MFPVHVPGREYPRGMYRGGVRQGYVSMRVVDLLPPKRYAQSRPRIYRSNYKMEEPTIPGIGNRAARSDLFAPGTGTIPPE